MGLVAQMLDDFARESHRRARRHRAGSNKELLPVQGVSPEGQAMRWNAMKRKGADRMRRRWLR